MNIAVLTKQVPDLVEGVEIAASGKALDPESIRFILSESDDHALEEALLLKEKIGGRVEVYSLETGEAREMLISALTKGAERAVMLTAGLEAPPENHTAAHIFASPLRTGGFDLILTGVRAIDDLDGSLGGLVAGRLGLPYVGLVRKIEVTDGASAALVQKEYPGGYAAELEVKLPAVLGIQAAEQPPRYVPVSRLRQVMKTATVEELNVEPPPAEPLEIERLFKPQEGQRAARLAGQPDEVVRQIVDLLSERHLLR